ncbi:MAG: hypothetical protein ACRCT1_16905 [Microcoleaceae cyanobacterium]|jgi:hypothetical protein
MTEGRRKKEEGRRKKEEGRRKKEEGRKKNICVYLRLSAVKYKIY